MMTSDQNCSMKNSRMPTLLRDEGMAPNVFLTQDHGNATPPAPRSMVPRSSSSVNKNLSNATLSGGSLRSSPATHFYISPQAPGEPVAMTFPEKSNQIPEPRTLTLWTCEFFKVRTVSRKGIVDLSVLVFLHGFPAD